MTREEAIKSVKQFFTGMGIALSNKTKEAFESLIPELAESEDERITKELIEIVESYRINCVYDGAYQFDKCLAWLKKQKEQPTNEEILRTLRAEYEKGVADTIAKYEETIEALKEKYKNIKKDYYDTKRELEKQKEQKPIEWSKRDKYMLERVKDSIEIAKSYSAHSGECYDEELDWIEALPKRFNLSKKQKWSEEDKKMLAQLIMNQEILIDNASNDELRDKYLNEIHWLKFISTND